MRARVVAALRGIARQIDVLADYLDLQDCITCGGPVRGGQFCSLSCGSKWLHSDARNKEEARRAAAKN